MRTIKVMRGGRPATPEELTAAVEGRPLPRILHLTLTRHWFDEIASGRKKEEYQEIKPHWSRRLHATASMQFKKFDEVHFRNGYSKDAPFMRVEVLGIEVKDSNLLNYGVCYAIKLGKILEIKNHKL